MSEPIRNSCVAIETKFLGPTNTLGARIKAWMPDYTTRKAVTIAYDDAASQIRNHAAAAVVFAAKHKLTGNMVAGSVERGYVFVFVDNNLETWGAK